MLESKICSFPVLSKQQHYINKTEMTTRKFQPLNRGQIFKFTVQLLKSPAYLNDLCNGLVVGRADWCRQLKVKANH